MHDINIYDAYFKTYSLLYSVGANGNIEAFANSTDSGESPCNKFSYLKSALLGCF